MHIWIWACKLTVRLVTYGWKWTVLNVYSFSVQCDMLSKDLNVFSSKSLLKIKVCRNHLSTCFSSQSSLLVLVFFSAILHVKHFRLTKTFSVILSRFLSWVCSHCRDKKSSSTSLWLNWRLKPETKPDWDSGSSVNSLLPVFLYPVTRWPLT